MKLSKRLFKLADYCEAQGPDNFDFSTWVATGTLAPTPCGTVCCLLGHSPGAFRDEPNWASLWFEYGDDYVGSVVGFRDEIAHELLSTEGMTGKEFSCAFLDGYQRVFWGDETKNLGDASLADAVANLRRLAKHIQESGR